MDRDGGEREGERERDGMVIWLISNPYASHLLHMLDGRIKSPRLASSDRYGESAKVLENGEYHFESCHGEGEATSDDSKANSSA